MRANWRTQRLPDYYSTELVFVLLCGISSIGVPLEALKAIQINGSVWCVQCYHFDHYSVPLLVSILGTHLLLEHPMLTTVYSRSYWCHSSSWQIKYWWLQTIKHKNFFTLFLTKWFDLLKIQFNFQLIKWFNWFQIWNQVLKTIG